MLLVRRFAALAVAAVAALALAFAPGTAHAVPVCDVPNPPPVCGPNEPDTAGTILQFTMHKQLNDPYSRVWFTYSAPGASSTRLYIRKGPTTAGLPWKHINTFSGGAFTTTPGHWYYSGEKLEFQVRSYAGGKLADTRTACVAMCWVN